MANLSLNGIAPSITGQDVVARAPSVSDPTVFHYRVWRKARAEWYRHLIQTENDQGSAKSLDALQRKELEARDAMLAQAPATLDGIAAVTHLLWDELGPSKANLPEEEYSARCEGDPILKMIAAIWRAASGSNTPPSTD